MEIADNILFFHTPEKHFDEQPTDGENDLLYSNTGFLTDIVDRVDRNIDNPKVGNIQPYQQIVWLTVAFVHTIPIDGVQSLFIYRRVTGLRISDMPVSRGNFGQQRQKGVSEIANTWNFLHKLRL